MNFEELNDDEWTLVSSLVSDDPPIRLNRRGRPRAEPRVVANAVLWILSTGESWSRLPARYPSGPTCRRRFEEWHLNGTLLDLVQLLSVRGRQFVYVPEAAAQPAARPVKAEVEEIAEDDGLPAVYWKSPEAWQAPSALAETPLADPIESMTRQLVQIVPDAVASDTLVAPDAVMPDTASADAVVARAVAADPGYLAREANRAAGSASHVMTGDADPCGADPRGADHATRRASVLPRAVVPASPMPVSHDEDNVAAARSPLWLSGAPQPVQMAEWRGYTMNLVVQPVRNRLYRAAVEILQDGRRVERSGLIGPPFKDRDAARQFAFDWARKWIERECRGGPAAATPGGVPVTRGGGAPYGPNYGSSAVVTRPAPPAAVAGGAGAPANARLTALHRLAPAGGLLAPGDVRDANGSTGGNSTERERRAAEPRVRTHAG